MLLFCFKQAVIVFILCFAWLYDCLDLIISTKNTCSLIILKSCNHRPMPKIMLPSSFQKWCYHLDSVLFDHPMPKMMITSWFGCIFVKVIGYQYFSTYLFFFSLHLYSKVHHVVLLTCVIILKHKCIWYTVWHLHCIHLSEIINLNCENISEIFHI